MSTKKRMETGAPAMDFDLFFRTATGHEPYEYQRRLACGDQGNQSDGDWLKAGAQCQSQLISVPTGLGKTAAVVLAWLWNRMGQADPDHRKAWPRRLVYCLPMRTLVEQTQENASRWIEDLAAKADELGLSQEQQTDLRWLADHSPVILMGGEDLDEANASWDIYPEKPCILIGTQDMLLSRALNRGYGMSRYRWPIHFGLLNNDCLWTMDETQLMGPGLWTSGQLDWMRNQRFSTLKPCVTWWMSATNSPEFLDTLDRRKEAAPRPLLIDVGEDKSALSRLNPTRPLSFWKDAAAKPKPKKKGSPAVSLSGALALAIHNEHAPGTLSLVVCNSVRAAQELYRALDSTIAILLTSRFRRGDRDAHTKRLLDFEKRRKAAAEESNDDTLLDSPGLICVATQVVEAGVDISARRLWIEAAPWPSALQRLGRLNRDGWADGRAKAFVFVGLEEGKKGKGQTSGPYEAKDMEASIKLLTRLAAVYENEPKLGAADAMARLRESSAAEIDAALKPKAEPFPRAMDVHGLFSTEPDVFGGFTDVSPWIRGSDKNADVTVFWRDFDAKNGPGKTDTLSGPALDAAEGCAVAIHRFRDFLGKGRALVWDDRAEQWQSIWPSDVCPGMVVMLPRSAGGYSEQLGWTGQTNDKPGTAEPPGRFSDTFDDDANSKRESGWITLDAHLADTKAEATRIAEALGLDENHRSAVVTAADLHDIGKAHPIWQLALPHTGDTADKLWAKAPIAGRFLPRPKGSKVCIRHEAASALAAWTQYFTLGAPWPGLTLFLIACHHGKVRTVLYARGEDGEDVCGVPKRSEPLPWAGGIPMNFSCAAVGTSGEFSEDGLAFTPALPGWTALVADLLGSWERRAAEPPPPLAIHAATEPRLFGPFSLAYLESIVRAADIRASKKPTDLRYV